MGLTNWKNAPAGTVLKSDVTVAKNYLDQLSTIGRLRGGTADIEDSDRAVEIAWSTAPEQVIVRRARAASLQRSHRFELARANVSLRPNGDVKLLLAEALEGVGSHDQASRLRAEVQASGWWIE